MDIRMYKHVVMMVEKFVARCPPNSKLASIYLVDNIVRKAKQFLVHNDVYTGRFSRNLLSTVKNASTNMPSEQKVCLF